MIIETDNGVTKLLAENNNKITNSERSFFSDLVYLGKNDSPDNYVEVPYAIWKHFVEVEPELPILQEELKMTNESVINLESVVLDTDFRLMVVEILLDLGNNISRETRTVMAVFSTPMKGVDKVFTLLKNKITRRDYDSKEEMQNMLDLYFFRKRITDKEYTELCNLLDEQE